MNERSRHTGRPAGRFGRKTNGRATAGHPDAGGRRVAHAACLVRGLLSGVHHPLEGAVGHGLRAKYRGQSATVRTPAVRVLSKTRQKPPDGSTDWSMRKLGQVLGIGHMLVAPVWRRAGYQPHRMERYMLSEDPQLEERAANVIGLYLNPPRHAVVSAANAQTAIQALDRLHPDCR